MPFAPAVVDLPDHNAGNHEASREWMHNRLETILQQMRRCGVFVA